MRTVIRNDKGEISHLHYTSNLFLPKDEHALIEEQNISVNDVRNAFDKPDFVLAHILNGNADIKQIKLQVLMDKGFVFHPIEK